MCGLLQPQTWCALKLLASQLQWRFYLFCKSVLELGAFVDVRDVGRRFMLRFSCSGEYEAPEMFETSPDCPSAWGAQYITLILRWTVPLTRGCSHIHTNQAATSTLFISSKETTSYIIFLYNLHHFISMTEELYVILIRNIPTTELKTKYLARAGVITQEISSPSTSISTFEERESETFVYFTSLWIRRATERKKGRARLKP